MRTSIKIDDGYYGSGVEIKESIVEYGKDHHTKEILEFCKTQKEMAYREREIVNEDFVKDPNTMNRHLGGTGGGWTKEQQQENNRKSQIAQRWLKENDKEWNTQRSKKIAEGNLRAYKEGRKEVSCRPHVPGEFNHTNETKEKLSLLKKGKGVGGNNTNAKRVRDDNGNIFSTFKECAEFNGVDPSTVKRKVDKGIYQIIAV